jgi:quercetin 2,3-dioxygenase
VRVIAGSHGGVTGPIASSATNATYLDVHLPAGATFGQPVKDGHNAFVYVYEGALEGIEPHAAAVFSTEGDVEVKTRDGARFLLLAARPLGEPVVQYGPFVMNTREEIEQAIRDYQSGTLTAA